ncbi:hypothetical protein IPJ63_03960 [Candidatus Nomurabacteria bacterium]|nr:MAG: hypothetical protein IPJ63_03960 [Candidatus Nomurabacteria bacterium]
MQISSCTAAGLVVMAIPFTFIIAAFVLAKASWFKMVWGKFISPFQSSRRPIHRLAYMIVILVVLGAIFFGIRSTPKPQISVYQCTSQEEENTTAFFDCGCGD